MSTTLEEILAGRSICICAGAGGVGKTTTAAAIAAGMAARGLKVAVLTIDPAKRLADSLGVEELGNVERRVDPAVFERAGVDPGEGELWAMMLDPKATFDGVVTRYAPDEESLRRILDNRIYQQISTALAGSQEFMAMERLYEVHEEGGYDLLVLDTPPSRNALDFLDAPGRLIGFIEGRSLALFRGPAGLGLRFAGLGAGMISSVVRRLTGLDLIEDLSEFFAATAGMLGGFRQRAERVGELLADERTSFLIVCGPAEEPIEEALHLREKLDEGGLQLGCVIVNRIHPGGDRGAREEDPSAALREKLGDADLVERVLASHAAHRAIVERDTVNVSRLVERTGGAPMIRVPELDDEVNDLAGLLELGPYLFGDLDGRRDV